MVAATSAAPASAAAAERPVAGQQVHFPDGTWAGVPQPGPPGKVRQCVLVAPRERSGKDGAKDTRFSLIISMGSGLTVAIGDDGLSPENLFDDQAELVIDGHSFPADAFSVGPTLAFHPGDAAPAFAMLGKAKQVTLRSAGAGVDTGAITLALPGAAFRWLKQCGEAFDIALDHPSDPNAPGMPTPQPRSPKVAFLPATVVGPPGMADKQKIDTWDASELRAADGTIAVCIIRRHYVSPDPNGRTSGTFLMVSRARGFTMMLKDSTLNLPENQPVEATLTMGDTPFTAFSAHVLGNDEIGIFPEHGAALATAIEGDWHLNFKSKPIGMEFPVQGGVIGWLRACSRRNGIPFEPAAGQ